MKRVLITGSEGFIAKELVSRFKHNEEIDLLLTNRKTLDVLDFSSVDNFFSRNEGIDYVIHTAVAGGRRLKSDGPEVLYQNLLMFENLAKYREKYKLLITFGSGAEYDRVKGSYERSESEFASNSAIPSDYYGFSKYIISRRINDIHDNIINLRLFNVFGEHEAENRMIKNSLERNVKGESIVIHQNKWMDFFSSEDLFKVVEYLLNTSLSSLKWRDINMCYTEKTTLEDIAFKIINATGINCGITFDKGGFSPPYSGDGTRLGSFGLKFKGLDQSIRELMRRV
tara:strand:+ start:6355 stop:7206 length:852 start_codon:yes stop_codon:yes gene_type:complete